MIQQRQRFQWNMSNYWLTYFWYPISFFTVFTWIFWMTRFSENESNWFFMLPNHFLIWKFCINNGRNRKKNESTKIVKLSLTAIGTFEVHQNCFMWISFGSRNFLPCWEFHKNEETLSLSNLFYFIYAITLNVRIVFNYVRQSGLFLATAVSIHHAVKLKMLKIYCTFLWKCCSIFFFISLPLFLANTICHNSTQMSISVDKSSFVLYRNIVLLIAFVYVCSSSKILCVYCSPKPHSHLHTQYHWIYGIFFLMAVLKFFYILIRYEFLQNRIEMMMQSFQHIIASSVLWKYF